MKNLLISLSLLAFLAFLSSCKHKSPCEVITCKKRQICDDGVCKCDSQSLNMGDWCFPKSSGNELIFYNLSSDCACFDTTVLSISPEPRLGINTGGFAPLVIDMTAIFPQNERGGMKSVEADYFKKPDGDSLYATNDYLWGAACVYDNNTRVWSPVVMGKFNKAKDTLTMKIKFYEAKIGRTNSVLIDSCTKIYTRIVK